MPEISQKRPYLLAYRTYKDAALSSLGLAAIYWICHSLICLISSGMSLGNLEDQFLYLDSRWYGHIAENGYVATNVPTDGPNSAFAFFPLWPMLLRSLHFLLHHFLPIQLTGALLAQILFFTTLLIVGWRKTEFDSSIPSQGLPGLVPKTWTGLAFLCCSPGAWVFFSNHTESLFLILSWSSLFLAMRSNKNSNLFFASVLAGLSALTRNQGIIVSIATAFAFLIQPNGSIGRRIGSFLVSGAIAGAIYLIWPAYQWYLTGNPLTSVEVQQNWQIVSSAGHYVSNLFWISTTNFGHRALFWFSVVTGGLLFKNSQSRPLGAYVILSALLWPLQGNSFPNAYRFGSVLFPVWFFGGDKLQFSFSNTKYLKFGVFTGLIGWSCMISFAYFSRLKDVWPY